MAEPGRLRRFLHLERARPARPAQDPPGGAAAEDDTRERIAAVERPQAPGGAPHRPRTGAQLERFGPEPEPTLELVEAEGRRAFIRCRRCFADNNVFATRCGGCGLDLDTPEQHAFDQQFWAARDAEALREARQAAERQALMARAEAEARREQRAAAEALAREVGDRERRRLGWMRGGGTEPWSPLGLKLIRRLVSDERGQILVMAGAAGLAAVLCAHGVHVGSAPRAAAGALALLLLLIHAPD